MLRFIVRCIDYSAQAHGVEMPTGAAYRTFDLDGVSLEAFLRNADGSGNYEMREVTGVEILPLTAALAQKEEEHG